MWENSWFFPSDGLLRSRVQLIQTPPADVFQGPMEVDGHTIQGLDTPDIRNFFAGSEDERVTLKLLRQEKPDLIVQTRRR